MRKRRRNSILKSLMFVAVTLYGQSIDSKTIFPSDSRPFIQAEDKEIIQAACPGHEEKGGKVECGKNCPSSSELDGGQHFLDWSLRFVTRGHFRSPSSDDAVVTTYGCEPHGSNWGGSVLLTRSGGRWLMIWYKAGLETSRCHKVPIKSGREVLVCLGDYGAQDNIWTQLYTVDLISPKRSLMANEGGAILQVFDNTLACAYFDETKILKHALLERIDFVKAQGDKPSVSVTLSLGNRQMTSEATAACIAKPPRRSLFIPPMRRYTIDFVFDGKDFEPTPASRALEKRLGLK